MSEVLVAFGGKKGSGKSTVSKYLVSTGNYEILSFSTKLKELVSNLFDFDDECYNVNKKEVVIPNLGVSPRQLMQKIGTELFRDGLPKLLPDLKLCKEGSIWINLTKIKSPKVVVDDVRFIDEKNFITKNGGICIEILRERQWYNPFKMEYFTHQSERVPEMDIQVLNDGSIKDLTDKVDNIIKEWTDMKSGRKRNNISVWKDSYRIDKNYVPFYLVSSGVIVISSIIFSMIMDI